MCKTEESLWAESAKKKKKEKKDEKRERGKGGEGRDESCVGGALCAYSLSPLFPSLTH